MAEQKVVPVILRRSGVEASTGLSRSLLYALMAEGLFVRPIKLAPRAVGWPADEVAAINSARIAGSSEAALRKLVKALEQKRSRSTR